MQRQIERALSIKYILVIGNEYGRNGEHRKNTLIVNGRSCIVDDGYQDKSRVERVVKQIELIGQCALDNYKPQYLTCVITDEFSFYPCARPFDLNEYKEIIYQAAKALSDYPPNLIFILSSMPVLWSDGSIRNAVLHIQTPNAYDSLPIIHHFSKTFTSFVDPVYLIPSLIKKDKIEYYEIKPDDYSGKHSPDIILQDTYVSCNSPDQYGHAIVVRGLNVAPIVITTDVCVDHSHQVAKHDMDKLLKKIKGTFPFYTSHILTSNTIKPIKHSLIASPVQADWIYKQVGNLSEKKIKKFPAEFGYGSCSVYFFPKMGAEFFKKKAFKKAAYYSEENSGSMMNASVNSNGNTLLHQLFFSKINFKKFKEMMQYFNEKTINLPNAEGDTVLHLALKILNDGHPIADTVLLTLLKKGAKLIVRNNAGKTPIDLIPNYKKSLITLLINQILYYPNIYFFNREDILEILNFLEDVILKKEIANAALYFELTHYKISEINLKQAIALLMIIENDPVEVFITQNIHQILLSLKKEILYYHLIAKDRKILLTPFKINEFDIFLMAYDQIILQIEKPAKEIIQNIIQQAIAGTSFEELNKEQIHSNFMPKIVSDKSIAEILFPYLPSVTDEIKRNLIKKIIKQFVYLEIIKTALATTSNNTAVITFSWSNLSNINFRDNTDNLNIAEQLIAHAAKTNNPLLLDFVTSKHPSLIKFSKFNVISENEKSNKYLNLKWLFENSLTNEIRHYINNQYKVSDKELKKLFYLLSFPFFLNFKKNIFPGITLRSQLIALAYFIKNKKLLDIIIKILYNYKEKIDIDVVIKQTSTAFPLFDDLELWIYQAMLENELHFKSLHNLHIIKAALLQPLDFKKTLKKHVFSLAEELVYIACKKKDIFLLEAIRDKLPWMFSHHAIHIFCIELDEYYKRYTLWIHTCVVKLELSKKKLANLNVLSDLMAFCDIEECNENHLTIGENLIMHAYRMNSSHFLDVITAKCAHLFNSSSIDNIATVAIDPIAMKNWLCINLINNELKRLYGIDEAAILFALSISPEPVKTLENLDYTLNVSMQARILTKACHTDSKCLLQKVISIYNQTMNFKQIAIKLKSTPMLSLGVISWLEKNFNEMKISLASSQEEKLDTGLENSFYENSLILFPRHPRVNNLSTSVTSTLTIQTPRQKL